MKLLRVFICLVFFHSCQDIEETTPPSNLIPEAKMVEVLTDLALVNSAKNYNKRFLEETGFKPQEYLLEKHNLDSLQLAQSTEYYARNFNRFESMYGKVQRNLARLKAGLEIKMAEENRIRDSIALLENENDTIVIDSTFLRIITRDSLLNPPRMPARDRENSIN